MKEYSLKEKTYRELPKKGHNLLCREFQKIIAIRDSR